MDAARVAARAQREHRRESRQTKTFSAPSPSKLRRQLAVEDGSHGKGRQTCLHLVVECFEDLFGEESIERLRELLAVFDLGSRHAGQSDHCRPAVRQRDETRCRGWTSTGQNFRRLNGVHRERRLVQLQHLVVEDPARADPRRSKPRRDQELNGRRCNDCRDEMLGVLSPDDLVVVVEDEPAVGRPALEILRRESRRGRRPSRWSPIAPADARADAPRSRSRALKRLAPSQAPAPLHRSTTDAQ